jgi:hypothetical protein
MVTSFRRHILVKLAGGRDPKAATQKKLDIVY